jgi:hypothetical protein
LEGALIGASDLRRYHFWVKKVELFLWWDGGWHEQLIEHAKETEDTLAILAKSG